MKVRRGQEAAWPRKNRGLETGLETIMRAKQLGGGTGEKRNMGGKGEKKKNREGGGEGEEEGKRRVRRVRRETDTPWGDYSSLGPLAHVWERGLEG